MIINNLRQLKKMDRKIRWLFIFSSVAFFCFMIILYQQTRSQEATRMRVYNTHTVLKKLERINTLVSETESVTRGYMLTKDTAWKTALALAHKQLQQSVQEIEELNRANLPAKNNLPALKALIAKKESYQNELINAPVLTSELIRKVRSDNEARQITRGIRALLADMIRDEEQLLTERIAKNEKDYNTGVYFALLGGIFAFFLVLAVLVELNSDIHLRKKAEEEVSVNETKYRNLIENAGVVVFTADANGNITFSNTLVTELTGYGAGELMGKHFSVLVHPSAAEEVATFYGRQFVHRIPAATLEFPTRTKSGDIKWVEQFSQLLYDGDEIIGFQCMVKDITEKKKIESELNVSELKRKENEYRLTAILDNTTTLIFIKDLHGRYIMVNKRFKDVFGLTDEMVINKTDYDFNSIERANHYKELDNQVMATLSSLESEELVETAVGKRNLLLVKFPLLDDKQQVFGISGIATDITDRVQSRQELETALSHAREAKELQDQFLANMSHEIRTPLNGIQGMTSLLLETPLNEDQKEFTNMIKRSLHNLVAIVNDVLDFSNIKAGKLTLEKIAFNLAEAVDTVKGQFMHQLQNKGLELEVNIADNVPPVLIGDPSRLKQVLVSLVGNAVKFTRAGQIKVRASITRQTDLEAWATFVIEDTGIGIPNDKLDTIFESFAQANMDISRGYGGAGLGLAISKGLIQVQGGEISVQSIPGEGTVFTFSIPYGLKQKPERPSTESDLALPVRGKRFLVVEDNEVNQKLIAFVLKKAGALVDIASNGKEAVAYFEQQRQYDLVIMDLQMPVMDGYQTATYIRQELGLDIPIMAMTATALKGDQEKCRQVGMNDFMLKPFDFNDLYKRLGNLLFPGVAGADEVAEKKEEAEKLYDLSLLEELDDRESLLDVITLFLDSTPPEMTALPALVAEKNWKGLYRQAHKIKGAVAILQSTAIASLLGKIEANAKEEKDLAQTAAYVDEAVVLFAAMEKRLRQEQQQIQKELASTK